MRKLALLLPFLFSCGSTGAQAPSAPVNMNGAYFVDIHLTSSSPDCNGDHEAYLYQWPLYITQHGDRAALWFGGTGIVMEADVDADGLVVNDRHVEMWEASPAQIYKFDRTGELDPDGGELRERLDSVVNGHYECHLDTTLGLTNLVRLF